MTTNRRTFLGILGLSPLLCREQQPNPASPDCFTRIRIVDSEFALADAQIISVGIDHNGKMVEAMVMYPDGSQGRVEL